METTTSFDLSKSIRLWRENLTQSPAFRGENIYELESHLRDSIATLQTQGLSAGEGFLIAARRLGRTETLADEFGKMNAAAVWRDRALWMLAGMLFLVIGWNFSLATYTAIIYFSSLAGVSGFVLGWIGFAAGFAALGFFGALFWLMVTNRMSRWNEVAIWLRSRPIGCAAILLGTVLAMKILAGIFATLLIQNTGAKVLGRAYSISTLFSALGPVFAVAAMIILFARLLSGRTKSTGGIRMSVWILVPFIIASLLPSRTFAQVKPDSGMSSAKGVAEKIDGATLDDIMKLWSAGKKEDATAKFLAVDFSRRPLFLRGSVLNYSEAQFMALPEAAREKLSKPVLDDIAVPKQISANVNTSGKTALAAGDKTKADQCNAKLLQCGEAFDQPDSLALLNLVGKALKKLAAN